MRHKTTAARRPSQTFPTFGAPKVRTARDSVDGMQEVAAGQGFLGREIFKFRRQR